MLSFIKKPKIIFIIIVLVLASIFYSFKFASHYPWRISLDVSSDFWGVTFSKKFARELGLDWREAYLATLDDLKVKNVRLPIYWDEIEASDGRINLRDYDYMLHEGARRQVKFVANIGWRLPRWPECHAPKWTETMSQKEIQDQAMDMLKILVLHYRDHPEIVAWQVENEPLLDWFGICPPADEDFLKKEVELVRSLSDKPIIISASGELSTWRREADIGDVLATTMYRVVWNSWFGYLRYPYPAWFYRAKASLIGLEKDERIISELQTEPWVPNGSLADIKKDEYYKSFSPDQFRANLQYAINTGFGKTYLWGVEWWYQEHLRGNDDYWNIAKEIFEKK